MKKNTIFSTEELPLSDDYFDALTLKSAVWNYLIDHASAIPGELRVFITVKNEQDFWRRVSARKCGDYRVKDERKLMAKAKGKQKRLQELQIGKAKADKKQLRFDKLRYGSLTERTRYYIALFLRQTANKIIRL